MNQRIFYQLMGLTALIALLSGCGAPPNEPSVSNASLPAPTAPAIVTIEEENGAIPEPIETESSELENAAYPPPAEVVAPAAYPAADAAYPAADVAPSSDSANADVTFVRAVQAADGRWTFHVTVAHPDLGWDDYADGWDVVAPDGTVLKANEADPFTRLLLHPHENEQPFTRSQSGLIIPENITQVVVRAHDLVDGWGGQTVVVDLTASEGENFVVER